MSKVVNFHLPADDVERAARFYETVFGWRFSHHGGAAIPYLVCDADDAGAGVPMAITRRQAVVQTPTPTIDVLDIDRAMTDIAMNGGQQALVHDIAGLGRFGYAVDSEGNVIALLQRETS